MASLSSTPSSQAYINTLAPEKQSLLPQLLAAIKAAGILPAEIDLEKSDAAGILAHPEAKSGFRLSHVSLAGETYSPSGPGVPLPVKQTGTVPAGEIWALWNDSQALSGRQMTLVFEQTDSGVRLKQQRVHALSFA